MQKEIFVDLLPCVTCLKVSHLNFIFSILIFNFQFNYILIVHNDHMVDLVNLVNLTNESTC
jgi:hypothetical protein